MLVPRVRFPACANFFNCFFFLISKPPIAQNENRQLDSMAEWSKALASGASPKGRGFEPHCCHIIYVLSTFYSSDLELVGTLYALKGHQWLFGLVV